jgi:2-phospho-L-lactate/phosphoenolpyruvate guanylyltransferase
MITAVVPVKETNEAKQRLAGMLSSAQRQALALAMFEDVLAALVASPELGRILVVTVDPAAAAIAARYGACVTGDGARDGHTGAVAAARRLLGEEDLLQVPGDIPLVEPDDIGRLIAAHDADRRAFTIVPARDQRGSNAVLCSPAGAVPLRFGENSFFPHLAAARACGIEPKVVRLPRIALDIDTPYDLALLRATASRCRASALLACWQMPFQQGIEASA